MSKVKFIQWGTDANPKQYEERWSVDEQGSITESSDFAKVKEDYKGGIIFVTYLDAKDKITQEIWANGVQYSVGGGGGGNVIYGATAVGSDGTAGDITGDEGYIYIYQSDTAQTAYYWNNGKWKPFNVDAENIYFPNGFERTEAWGYFTASADGTLKNETKPTEGEIPKNLVQVFEHYLVKPIFPTGVKVQANVPNATFTAAYTTASPISISAVYGNNALASSKHVLVNSEISLSSSFNSAIKIANHVETLVYGPISITGMTYGGRHKSENSDSFTVFTQTSLSGDSVTLTSEANSSVTRGTRTLTLSKKGSNTTLKTVDHDSTNTNDMLSLTDVSYTVSCGSQTIKATGSTGSVFERTIKKDSKEYNDTSVTIPKLPYIDIEYYNNKKSETNDVPENNSFDPKANHIVSIEGINKSAGVGAKEAEFIVTGYYPIWYGLLSGSKVTNVGTKDTLTAFEKIDSNGFTGSAKTVYITPSSSQGSGSYTPFIIAPANCTVQFGRFDKPITQVYAQGTEVQVVALSDWTTDGAGDNIDYKAYILNGSTISWSGNSTAKFTLKIS